MQYDNAQIFTFINQGLVIVNRDMVVSGWNHWMAHHSDISEKEILGRNLLDFYPNLAEPKYHRLVSSVFTFGNYAYFSQKLHRYLFPMKNPHTSLDTIPHMQQNCTAGPIRNLRTNIVSIYFTVQDVTENVSIEMRLREKVVELEEALGKVKMLEGIIPICMYCKKIRDNEESWQQLENYITKHSEALFSHGICPECFEKKPWLKR